jgi:hypothetical protein
MVEAVPLGSVTSALQARPEVRRLGLKKPQMERREVSALIARRARASPSADLFGSVSRRSIPSWPLKGARGSQIRRSHRAKADQQSPAPFGARK